MLFVYPAFLLGLLSLAIPIIIHLFHFRQYKKVYFSNVQFLKNIQQQQSSRRNLKKRIILVVRMLALAFLVLAFAKPFIPARRAASVTGKLHVLSIFIDNSYSMQTVNREGSLLDEARRRAKEIASGYGINDRFQLLTQDFEGQHQRLLNRDEFDDEVDKIKISPQSRMLQQIISRQQSLLNTSVSSDKSIYILSDFQKNLFSSRVIKTDSSVQISLIRLKAMALPNITVDSVWLLSAVHRVGEGEKLVVQLHNYADEKAEKVPLKLLINGAQKALGSFTLKAREIQNDTLAFSGLQAGWQQAEIQLQDNPVNFDNQFYFTFKVQRQMPVLLVDGGTPNRYLQAVFNTDAFFNVKQVHDGNVDYAALGTYPLVVLSDVKTLSTGLAQQLKTYIGKGGNLVVFPADGADLESYRLLLQPLQADYPEKLLTGKNKVSGINLQSTVFKNIFEQAPQNPDLPLVNKYYQLSNLSRSGRESLLELPGKQTFFGAYPYQKGKVYVSAVALDDSYSNLTRHALFVPLMIRITLLSGHDPALFYTIGEDELVETLPVQSSDKQVLKLTNGQRTIIPDVRQQEGSTMLYLSDQVSEPGNYSLTRQDSVMAILAFNNSRSESDMSYLDDEGLKAQFSQKQTAIIQAGGASLKDTVAKANIGLELWKLCIILSLICLAGEILLIRFYKPEKQVVKAQA
ncbi:BatA domain-containing protein [Mucilaginibacter paludis]|uniref:Double-transmembrane region domain protein n=1 Tax=Mucilaginibacter paludis DSM 18603 TaxID=714943 RepID=H1Y965_9SPHI|nr:BatA domain-containing protein [Mucilaginibacter paludis]EHQ29443.1 double-transmembrane region domain protein [Mucilaginibacter paludis DSM 18603]